jgi:hypothetical protein
MDFAERAGIPRTAERAGVSPPTVEKEALIVARVVVITIAERVEVVVAVVAHLVNLKRSSTPWTSPPYNRAYYR